MAHVAFYENEPGNGKNTQVVTFHAMSAEFKVCSSVDKPMVAQSTVEQERMSVLTLLPAGRVRDCCQVIDCQLDLEVCSRAVRDPHRSSVTVYSRLLCARHCLLYCRLQLRC